MFNTCFFSAISLYQPQEKESQSKYTNKTMSMAADSSEDEPVVIETRYNVVDQTYLNLSSSSLSGGRKNSVAATDVGDYYSVLDFYKVYVGYHQAPNNDRGKVNLENKITNVTKELNMTRRQLLIYLFVGNLKMKEDKQLEFRGGGNVVFKRFLKVLHFFNALSLELTKISTTKALKRDAHDNLKYGDDGAFLFEEGGYSPRDFLVTF